MSQCKGIIQKGHKCKIKVKNDEYCFIHKPPTETIPKQILLKITQFGEKIWKPKL